MRKSPIPIPSTAIAVSDPPPAAVNNPPIQPSNPGARGRITFGKIAAKKSDDTKTVYPVFPDDNGEAAIIAARILERSEKFEALKGAIETDKAELKLRTAPHYFTVNSGRKEIPSSISVQAKGVSEDDPQKEITGEVLVCFQNRYPLLPDDSQVLGVLGDRTSDFFKQSFEIKIKGDSLPQDKVQELMDQLSALFDKYGATDALEVKDGFKPDKAFHEARHSKLTVQENLAVEQVCPITAMVKTKGRK